MGFNPDSVTNLLCEPWKNCITGALVSSSVMWGQEYLTYSVARCFVQCLVQLPLNKALLNE